jgi:hypothetical protein
MKYIIQTKMRIQRVRRQRIIRRQVRRQRISTRHVRPNEPINNEDTLRRITDLSQQNSDDLSIDQFFNGISTTDYGLLLR